MAYWASNGHMTDDEVMTQINLDTNVSKTVRDSSSVTVDH